MMKIKRIVISVVCLLLAVMLAVGGYCGVIAVKSHYDTQMQEQYDAGYTACNDEVKHKMNVLTAEIADLQKRLVNVGDPAIAALIENVGTALENGDDAMVETLLTDYQTSGGSQSVVDLLQTLIGFASEYAALQAELDEMTKLNEEILANSLAESIKLNNQIKELNTTIVGLQAQIEELQKNTGNADYSAIENGDCKVVTFKVGDDVHAVKVVEKGTTVTVNDPQASSAIQGLTSKVEWNLNGTPVDLSTYAVTENIILDAKFKYTSDVELEKMNWNASGVSLSDANYFDGAYVWTDGVDYYYSKGAVQFVLDKSTHTWRNMTWGGSVQIAGCYIWTDGNSYFYSSTADQYILDVSTHTWSRMNWNGATKPIIGASVWTDGINYYYSEANYYDVQYVLDKSTHTWSKMTWNGLANFDGKYIWTDGSNYYYSQSANQYVLDTATHTWSRMTWNGFSNINGVNVWSDGVNYYYSVGSAQYVLDKSTHTWCEMTWSGCSTIIGGQIWTDGTDRYYSYQNNQYVFNKAAAQ